jgi:hypothetical protein
MSEQGPLARRALVLFSWDGKSTPLACLDCDTTPAFDILLFDYSGSDRTPHPPMPITAVLSGKTECKGQIFKAFHDYVRGGTGHDYVALIDDDISVAVSALNGALALARTHRLDSFSLSLTPGSHINHSIFVQRTGSSLRAVPWVEVMMPFYRRELFLAGAPFYQNSISSYGIDQFVMPLMSKLTGMANIAVIDAYAAGHYRPVTSDTRTFSNGLTAKQERVIVWQNCLKIIRTQHPALLATRWLYRTFAPLDGPARFWTLYLGLPWQIARRLVSHTVRRQRPPHARNEAQ